MSLRRLTVSLAVSAAALLLAAPPAAAQAPTLKKPTIKAAPGVKPAAPKVKAPAVKERIAIKTVNVAGNKISFVGADGKTVALPRGKFQGPGGLTFYIGTNGRVTEFKSAAPKVGTKGQMGQRIQAKSSPALKVGSVKSTAGALSFVGTNGREMNLPSGDYMGPNGFTFWIGTNGKVESFDAGK